MEQELSVEYITVIPHNQYTFKYIINEGNMHTIRKENIFNFLVKYTPKTCIVELKHLLDTFQPFIIEVNTQIVTLKKEDDFEYYKDKIKNEMFSAIKFVNVEKTEDRISNDYAVDGLVKKIKRFGYNKI
jgi:hypothetical protein